MKSNIFINLLLLLVICFSHGEDIPTMINDNEFAEFEVADEPFVGSASAEEKNEGNYNKVEDINEEKTKSESAKDENFENLIFLADQEEFDFEKSEEASPADDEQHRSTGNKPADIKPLTFADIPSHFRSNWSSYQVESIALLIIFVYILNYIYGKSRNHSNCLNWYSNNRERMEKQFALVGDDGTSTEEMDGGHLISETECSYSIWCTGRVGCRSMMTQLKLCKRQDLLGVALNLIRPRSDKVIHKIDMDPGEIDSFVIIFGQRKCVQKMVKEMTDLAAYVTEKKNIAKVQLPSSFCVFAEIAETVPAIIDATATQFLNKCEKYVEYIHISDQYSGPKQQDEQYSRLPETHPTLVFSYVMAEPEKEDGIDSLLMDFTFYMLDKVRHYRLSKEGKNRTDKKRQNVQENFLKQTHQQRQEAAQVRREEKTRERKQRVMEEENPEKQKRLEKMEQKRDAKQKQPKIKQFKIK